MVGLSMRQASAEFAHIVSPPKGGTFTARNVLIAGGSARNGESVCQPEPNTMAERSSACLITGCTSGCPGTPVV